ncbi:MAG: helix-turn-helix domain-containing protein [Actinomycetota bacterium]
MTASTPKIGRPQLVDEDGVPTRERILAAALDAFVERGYERATLGEIARAADVSPPAIYNHFSSKSALFVEAAQSALGAFASTGESRDPREMLQADAPPDIRHARRLLVELHAAALRHPDLDEALAAWQASHIERWVAGGHGTAGAARAYYVLVQGLALMDSLHADPKDADFRRTIERMTEALLDG